MRRCTKSQPRSTVIATRTSDIPAIELGHYFRPQTIPYVKSPWRTNSKAGKHYGYLVVMSPTRPALMNMPVSVKHDIACHAIQGWISTQEIITRILACFKRYITGM